MKKLKYKDFKISVYTDLREYGLFSWDMPEDAQIDEDFVNEVYGCAITEFKEISIYVPPSATRLQIQKTVAHEMGHIVEFNHATKPATIDPDEMTNDEIELLLEIDEQRAIFFETFHADVVEISAMIILSQIHPNTDFETSVSEFGSAVFETLKIPQIAEWMSGKLNRVPKTKTP